MAFRSFRIPWWPWVTALVIWTLLLITPGNWFPGSIPVPSVGTLTAGKLLHIGVYGLFAAATGWLPAGRHARDVIILGLIAHGGLTELIQLIIPYREGCWSDVGLDTVSTLTGWLLSRWFWPA